MEELFSFTQKLLNIEEEVRKDKGQEESMIKLWVKCRLIAAVKFIWCVALFYCGHNHMLKSSKGSVATPAWSQWWGSSKCMEYCRAPVVHSMQTISTVTCVGTLAENDSSSQPLCPCNKDPWLWQRGLLPRPLFHVVASFLSEMTVKFWLFHGRGGRGRTD